MIINVCSDNTNSLNKVLLHVRSSAVVREAHSPIQRNRTRSRAKVLNWHDMAFACDDLMSSYALLCLCWFAEIGEFRRLQQVSHQFFI